VEDREIKKLTLKVNSFWIKIKGINFGSQVLSRHTLKISRKKEGFFLSHGHFKKLTSLDKGETFL